MLKSADDPGNIKLIDFGLSKDFSEGEVMQTPSGSPYYIAPEVFAQKYTSKCDLWAMGVVSYILLSGKVPFPGDNNKEIIENVLKAEFHYNHESFRKVSDVAKDFINHLLVKDPDSRFDSDQAWNHAWLQSQQSDTVVMSLESFENIKQFKDGAQIRKLALTYMAAKLPESALEDLRASFISIDANGDGRLQEAEFKEAI